jgi:hypothetical protein
MQSIKFPGATLEIGKGQEQYNTLHAMPQPGPEGEVIMCFELTDEEIERIKETKKLWYFRWTFNHPFQPMRISTDLENHIELKP